MKIAGKNPIREALRANRQIHKVYAANPKDPLVSELKGQGVSVEVKDKDALDSEFGEGHQGIAAEVAPYECMDFAEVLKKPSRRVFLMLDSIEDPQNFGAIIRNADVFGADAVIFAKHRSSPITPAVVKVSAGSIEHVDLVRVTNLNQAIDRMKKENIWVVGLAGEAEKTIASIPKDTDLCLVLGNEHKGLRPLVRKNCDYLARIPMRGRVASLNVSVASGIALYEVTGN